MSEAQHSPQSDEIVLELKMAVRKVEMPLSDYKDPVGWITIVKVKLMKLSMWGATLHWLNLLHETKDDLTWVEIEEGFDRAL